METVKNIAAILGLVLSTFSVITLCSQKIKGWIGGLFSKYNKEQDKDIKALKDSVDALSAKVDTLMEGNEIGLEFTRQQCRDIVKDIFYKYLPNKILPVYERKRLDYIKEIYITRLHGNSYASELIAEMQDWEIDHLAVRNDE